VTFAVIGAGPAGLATVRNLTRVGLDVVGFEIHSDVGGLWDIDSPTSTMYDSAHLISSKAMTEFAEFPMDDSVAPYPHHSEMKTYFRDYARSFGLYERYEFETEVTWMEPMAEGGWTVTTRHRGREQRRDFEAVLIATGTLHHPNIPELPGHFEGKVIHSSEYRSPDIFAGRRTLIVGCGNSGADIAVDAVHHAASVDLSVRRGYYFVPKFLLGRPIDTIGGKIRLPRALKQRVDALILRLVVGKPSDYGLPDPAYRMYESHPVLNSQILHHLGHGDIRPRGDVAGISGPRVDFTDGTAGDFDLIVLATGYKLHYPFVDPRHLNWRGFAPRLYLNTFHPHRDDLFMLGMVEASGLGWEGRNEQAELVARYLRARADRRPAAEALRRLIRGSADERIDGGFRYLPLERMAYYVSKDQFRARVRRHIDELEEPS
jgi:hypothetical protein